MNLFTTAFIRLMKYVCFIGIARTGLSILKHPIDQLRTLTLALILLTLPALSFSQSSLESGEIVFTGYNADFPGSVSTDGGQFSFLLLRDIDPNTTIFFTDFGWDGLLGAFHTSAVTNDAVIEWTTATGLSCGTEVVITATSTTSATADIGTVVSGGLTFNSS